MSTLASVQPTLQRDRYGRPLVIPPAGGKPVAYTRCTTFVDVLEDKYTLQKWQQRMVVLGLVDRPDLLLSAAAHRDDKNMVNKVADDAIEAAKAHAAATVGTAIHALTERIDAGQEIGPVPGEYQRDLDAYVAATKALQVIDSECFTVLDDLRIGGTPDRIVTFEGVNYIADIKTGSIDYGLGKIAMQISVYAHSRRYNVSTGERTDLPDVSQERGIVIHLPAGTGTCRLVWVDLAAGWEAVQHASWVRTWRARKDLSQPFETPVQHALQVVKDAGLVTDTVLAQIDAATTPDQLAAIWQANRTDWTATHTAAASARKTHLAQTA